MRVPADQMCFLVSLYGTEFSNTDQIPLLGQVIDFLCAADQTPTHLHLCARGFGKKPLRFKRAWKRLQAANAGDVESITALSLLEEWKSQLTDWTAVCCVYPDITCFQLGASLDALPDAEPRIVAFIGQLLDELRPAYGIGFFRKRSRGPSLYGLGMGYGHRAYSGPEYEESLATSRWTYCIEEYADKHQGLLRDVYAYNLLTARHLERAVAGQPLRAWIAARAMRGQLRACADGYWLWTVDRAHIPAVREQLIACDALLAWRE